MICSYSMKRNVTVYFLAVFFSLSVENTKIEMRHTYFIKKEQGDSKVLGLLYGVVLIIYLRLLKVG